MKPLYAFLYKFGLRFIFPVAVLGNILFFILHSFSSKHFTSHLDSFDLSIPLKVLLAFICGDHLCFIIAYRNLFKMIISTFTLKTLVNVAALYISLYIYYSNAFVVFKIVHYTKHCTLVTLRQIHRQLLLITDACTLLELTQKFKGQLQQLATTNDNLNRFFSLPLLLMLTAQIFNIILLLSGAVFHSEAQVSILTYIGQFVLYLIFIAELQRQISAQLGTIEKTLLTICCTQTSGHFKVTTASFNQSFRLANMISIYRPYFGLPIFQLAHIDLPFLLTIAVFALNYIVLIAETSI